MAINKVRIEAGCIACGVCVATVPEVFEMSEDTAVVKEGVNFNEYEDQVKDAAEQCPVEVIKYE